MLEKIKSMFGYNKRKLARELQSALKAHGVSAPITYDQPNDCVLLGEHQSIYLGNIFHEISGLNAGDRKNASSHSRKNSFGQMIPKHGRKLPISYCRKSERNGLWR